MQRFRYLEHTADLKFLAFGNTAEGAFENAASAMFSAMVDGGLDSVSGDEKIKFELSAESLGMLLRDFLAELLFRFETEHVIFSYFKAGISGGGKEFSLKAEAAGERIDPGKHKITTDVKAVTYHGLYVRKKGDSSWEAQVLCDV